MFCSLGSRGVGAVVGGQWVVGNNSIDSAFAVSSGNSPFVVCLNPVSAEFVWSIGNRGNATTSIGRFVFDIHVNPISSTTAGAAKNERKRPGRVDSALNDAISDTVRTALVRMVSAVE